MRGATPLLEEGPRGAGKDRFPATAFSSRILRSDTPPGPSSSEPSPHALPARRLSVRRLRKRRFQRRIIATCGLSGSPYTRKGVAEELDAVVITANAAHRRMRILARSSGTPFRGGGGPVRWPQQRLQALRGGVLLAARRLRASHSLFIKRENFSFKKNFLTPKGPQLKDQSRRQRANYPDDHFHDDDRAQQADH